MYTVVIRGEYSELRIDYQTSEDALAGIERAQNKIAFSRSKLELWKDGKKINMQQLS